MRALGLGWEVSENTYWLLGRMLHHDPPMRAVLARMQGPLHLSKVLTLRLALPGQGGRWSGKALHSALTTQSSALNTLNSVLSAQSSVLRAQSSARQV